MIDFGWAYCFLRKQYPLQVLWSILYLYDLMQLHFYAENFTRYSELFLGFHSPPIIRVISPDICFCVGQFLRRNFWWYFYFPNLWQKKINLNRMFWINKRNRVLMTSIYITSLHVFNIVESNILAVWGCFLIRELYFIRLSFSYIAGERCEYGCETLLQRPFLITSIIASFILHGCFQYFIKLIFISIFTYPSCTHTHTHIVLTPTSILIINIR